MSETPHDNMKSTQLLTVVMCAPCPIGKECNIVTKRIPIVLGHFVKRTVLHLTQAIEMINHIIPAKLSPQMS